MKDIKPSLLGCGGIFALIGLILFIFFRDRIGVDIFMLGAWLMGAILLFWILSYVYRYFKNRDKE
ncbi:MAG: hypothetical protein ACR2MS_09885 [Weeksellaceae bacterium]